MPRPLSNSRSHADVHSQPLDSTLPGDTSAHRWRVAPGSRLVGHFHAGAPGQFRATVIGETTPLKRSNSRHCAWPSTEQRHTAPAPSTGAPTPSAHPRFWVLPQPRIESTRSLEKPLPLPSGFDRLKGHCSQHCQPRPLPHPSPQPFAPKTAAPCPNTATTSAPLHPKTLPTSRPFRTQQGHDAVGARKGNAWLRNPWSCCTLGLTRTLQPKGHAPLSPLFPLCVAIG